MSSIQAGADDGHVTTGTGIVQSHRALHLQACMASWQSRKTTAHAAPSGHKPFIDLNRQPTAGRPLFSSTSVVLKVAVVRAAHAILKALSGLGPGDVPRSNGPMTMTLPVGFKASRRHVSNAGGR